MKLNPCHQCGADIPLAPTDWPARYQAKRFCSRACANRARGIGPNTGYRYTKVNGRNVADHRLAAQSMLGRDLRSDEIVHHRNGDKLDNRPENLEVMTLAEHGLEHHPPRYPTVKVCEICDREFTPHKTKRKRQRTCGVECGRVLNRISRWGA